MDLSGQFEYDHPKFYATAEMNSSRTSAPSKSRMVLDLEQPYVDMYLVFNEGKFDCIRYLPLCLTDLVGYLSWTVDCLYNMLQFDIKSSSKRLKMFIVRILKCLSRYIENFIRLNMFKN